MKGAAVKVATYEDFRDAIDQHRRARGWTHEQVNFFAGLQDGYSQKLRVGIRNYGNISLPLTLAALDLEIVLTPKEQC